MLDLLKDPKILLFAILSGAVPAIFWLWFWLREEEDDHHESITLVIISFLLGGLIVFIAI